MNTTITRLEVATLADIDATHNFVDERTTTTLHSNPVNSEDFIKVEKLIANVTNRVVCSTPIIVRDWFGQLDLTVTSMDDDTIVLGKYFLKLSKEVLMYHKDILVFFDKVRMWVVLMTVGKKLRQIP